MTAVQSGASTGARPQIRRTSLAYQSWIMVKRNMIHTKRMPEMLSDVTAQPIMFVLLFAFVFGASITNTGERPTGSSCCRASRPRPSSSPRSSSPPVSPPTWRRASSTASAHCPSPGPRC